MNLRKRTLFCIFVKTPGLSPVKTRLRLSESIGQQVFRLSARSVFYEAVRVGELIRSGSDTVHVTWHLAESDSRASRFWPLPDQVDYFHSGQCAGDLADRLAFAYSRFIGEYSRVFFLGADSPTITVKHLREASDSLERNDFYLSPANDGGFYLFGGRRPMPASVWRSVAYSSPNTFNQFFSVLSEIGSIGVGKRLHDLDRPEDIEANREALGKLATPNSFQRQLLRYLTSIQNENLPIESPAASFRPSL